MQDNKPQNIDRQFEDLGWARMRELLDRDMPAPAAPWAGRRRLSALLLALLLIIGGGTIAWWMLSNPADAPVPARIELHSPSSVPEAPQAKLPAKDMEATEAFPAGSMQAPPEIREQVLQNTSIPGGTSAAKADSQPVDRRPAASTAVSGDDQPPRDTPAVPAIAMAAVSPPTVIGALEIILPEKPLAMPSVPWGKRPARPVHLSLEGGLLAASGMKPGGGSFGLNAFRQIGAGRWSMGAGLSFISAGQEISITEGSPLEQASQQVTAGSTGNAAMAAVPETIDARFRYLAMPLVVQRHLGRHFRLEGGVQVNYLISSSENRSGRLDELTADQEDNVSGPAAPAFNIDSYAAETVRLLSSGGGQGISNSRMNRFDLGLTGGITYLPAPRLGINLRYSFGLVDAVKSPDYQSYNRWLQLGLRYYIR